jgi:cytochrome c oxidase subunit III
MSSDVPASLDHAPAGHAPAGLPASGLKQPYHLVDPSPWPLLAALGGGLIVLGIVLAAHFGSYAVLVIGALLTVSVATLWWRDVWKESRVPGLHTPVVRLGLRYGMLFFICSEVMFFVAFFWAFFHFALYPEHVAGAATPEWPPAGIHTFDPFNLPLLNTMILLLSGCTVTWAHHSLIEGDRKHLVMGLGLTILLGLSFTSFQALEYSEAPFKFDGGGVYPSVFFLATGFHGFHVIIGTLFLVICWIRSRQNEFTPARHFGFEAAAWYWHFVDVVWLFLFICIYWWGAGNVIAE